MPPRSGRRGDRAQYDAPEPSLCQRAGRELAPQTRSNAAVFHVESHIHSLLNVLRYCNLEVAQLRSSSELDVRAPLDRLRVSSRVRSRPWITSVTSII